MNQLSSREAKIQAECDLRSIRRGLSLIESYVQKDGDVDPALLKSLLRIQNAIGDITKTL